MTFKFATKVKFKPLIIYEILLHSFLFTSNLLPKSSCFILPEHWFLSPHLSEPTILYLIFPCQHRGPERAWRKEAGVIGEPISCFPFLRAHRPALPSCLRFENDCFFLFSAVFYVFCFVIFFNVKKTYLVSVKWLVRVCIDLVLKF